MPDATQTRHASTGQTSGTLTPVTATIDAVVRRFRELKFFSALDEESITGALLGGFTLAFPYCVAQYGSNMPAEKLCWGHFGKSKNANGRRAEAEVGADFALVIYIAPNIARLALFQAKKVVLDDGPDTLDAQAKRDAKDKKVILQDPPTPHVFHRLQPLSGIRPGAWMMDVHRRPRRPAPPATGWRFAQMVMLDKFASRVADAVSDRIDSALEALARRRNYLAWAPTREDEAKRQRRDAALRSWLERIRPGRDIGDHHWVHYLGYASGSRTDTGGALVSIQEMVCVPLCDLYDARWRELARGSESFSHNWVDLASVRCHSLERVLLEGISPHDFNVVPEGWLTLHNDELDHFLPGLIDLTPVYVADDKGGTGGLSPALQGQLQRLSVAHDSDMTSTAAPSGNVPKPTRPKMG